MLSIPFPGYDEGLNTADPIDQQWAFSRIVCHVCPEVLLAHSKDPKVIPPDLLVEYLQAAYLLVYPLLDCGSNVELGEVRRFVTEKSSPSLGIVHCHGGARKEKWVLADRDTLIPAKKFLRSLDGEYSCIVCMACNPLGDVVELKHSALLYYSGLGPLYFTSHDRVKEFGESQLFYKLPGQPPVKVDLNTERSFQQLLNQADADPETLTYFDH